MCHPCHLFGFLVRSRILLVQALDQFFHPVLRLLVDLRQMLIQPAAHQHTLIPVLLVLPQISPAQHPVLPNAHRLVLYGQVRKQVVPLAVISQFHTVFLLR